MDADRPSLAALAEDIRACRICRDAPRYGPALSHEPRPVFQVSRFGAHLHRRAGAGRPGPCFGPSLYRPVGRPSAQLARDRRGASSTIRRSSRSWRWGFVSPVSTPRAATCLRVANAPNCGASQCSRALPNLELILLVGQYAQKWHLGPKLLGKSLSETVARWRDIYRSTDRPRLVPMPHPSWRNNAWLKRNPWFETELLPVLRADIARIVAPNTVAPTPRALKRSRTRVV